MKKALFLTLFTALTTLLNAQSLIFHENFDPPSNDDSIVASGATNNFAVNTRLYVSGTQCDSNLVTASGTAYMTTLSFSTAGLPNVFLHFDHICKIELVDTGKIEVSIDGGTSWTKLNASHYINSGGSQFVTSGNAFNSNSYPLLWMPTQNAVKPDQNWWKHEQFDISTIAGNQANVLVRFTLRDGNGNGANFNHGWYIDNLMIYGSTSELTPPTITMKPPVIQDTVYTTGFFDIYAWITDLSGIDTAYLVYQVNGGPSLFIPMTLVSDSTYKGIIPSYTYNTRIDYYVHAEDNSAAHNASNGSNQWFYIKQAPSNVTIGTGTSTSYYSPIYNSGTSSSYRYSNHIDLFTAAEINAGGNIQSIAWEKANALGYTLNDATLRIYLKHTTATTVPTASGTFATELAGATLVYQSTTQGFPLAAGWQDYMFNMGSFSYNGSSNLMVLVDYYHPSGADAFTWYYTQATSMAYTWAASTTPPTIGYGAGYRTNTKLGFQPTNYSYDAGITQITSPSGTVLSSASLPVDVVIKNFGTDTLNTVKVKWALDGILQDSTVWTGSSAPGVITLPFNIDYSTFADGPHQIKAWTEFPDNNADQNNMNDTASVSIYACASILNGVYTIGTTGDYPSFNAALTAMLNCGISGPVTFNVAAGTYNEQLNIPPISGNSAVNTITFQSASGVNTDVVMSYAATAAADNFVVQLNGADNIRFKNMTLQATSTASFSNVVTITNGANDNIFEGNRLIGVVTTSSTSTNMSIVYSPSGSTLPLDNNNIFTNNLMQGGSYGIYFYGQGSAVNQLETGNVFSGNTLTNQYYRGMIIYYQDSPQIIGNAITTNSAYTSFYGLQTAYCDNALRILKNKITMTGSGYGMYIYYCDGVSGNEGLTANNFVSIGGTSSAYGIYPYYSTVQDIVYNSVNVYTNYTTARAFYLSGTCAAINLKNNIFAYTGMNTSGFSIYIATTAAISSSDYNDLYSTGTNLGYWTTNRATLLDWQTASFNDAHSVSADPDFTSPVELHTFSPNVYALGTPLAQVSDDIDGEPRSLTTPCVGADEFELLLWDLAIDSVMSPFNSCAFGAAEPVSIRLKNLGASTINIINLYYSLNGGPLQHDSLNVTLAQFATMNHTFSATADLSAYGNYNILIYAVIPNEQNTLNDTVYFNFYNGWSFFNGPYTQGFEPAEYFGDWSVLNSDGTAYKWEIPYNSSTYSHTGANSARFYNSTSNTGEDWLFSRCFPLEAGTTYKISFWYRSSSTSYAHTVALKYGISPAVADMTNTLTTLTGFANTAYQQSVTQFTPPATGSYYFGWRGNPGIGGYVYMDDINIELVPDQDASLIGITEPISDCDMGMESVSVLIKNTGADTINGNLTAYYQVNGSTPVSQNVTSSIYPGDTLSFTFTTPVDMSVTTTDSSFNFISWINLLNDPFQFNDSVSDDILSPHTPLDPTVVNDTVFYGNPATLMALSPDSVFWFVDDTTTAYFHQGSAYVTPVLFDTATYYVSAGSGSYSYVGMVSSTNGTSGSGMTTYGLYFDALSSFLLKSVVVYPNSSNNNSPGTITISVINGSGTVLHQATVNVTGNIQSSNPTSEEVELNFNIQPANGLRLVLSAKSSNISGLMFQPSAQGPYPYPYTLPGIVSITSGTYSGTVYPSLYYYFYNWKIGEGGCASARVPVTAYVLLPPADIAVTEIITPVDACTFNSEIVTAKLKNYGTDTIHGYHTGYMVSGNPVWYIDTVTNNIAPGDSVIHTYSVPANTVVLAGDSTFTFTVFADAAGDAYHINDTLIKNVTLDFSPPDPVVTHDTIPYSTSATLSAISPYSLSWYDMPAGGAMLDTGAVFNTPVLYATTTYYVEAGGSGGSGGGGLKITEINIGDPDGIEIQNISGSAINATGWVVAVSDDYGIINEVNANLWQLGNIPAGQVLIKDDNSAGSQYWGSNLYWNPGAYPTYTGWAMIVDNQGNVVDFVAWGWPQSSIQSLSVTVNGFPITIGTEWIGNGVVDPSLDYIVRMNSDANSNTDWVNQASGSIGTANPGMVIGGGGSIGSGCPSHRIPVYAVVTGQPPVDAGAVAIVEPDGHIPLGNHDVKVAIQNFGTDTLTSVQIGWTVNGAVQTPFLWNGSLPTGDIDTVTIATHNFVYTPYPAFVDLVAWTYNPNGQTDTVNVNDTTSKQVEAWDPLSGIYYIRTATPDFADFTEANLVLGDWGVGGPVTIIADTGVYNEQISIAAIPGASAVNTVTFQSITGINTDVRLQYGATAAADNYVVRLSGADYVAFKNMTIKSTTLNNYGRVIELIGAANYNTFEGNILQSVPTTSSTAAVVYSYTSSGDSNNVFRNNDMLYGYYSAYIYGSSTNRKYANKFIDNRIKDWYYYGLYLYYSDSSSVIDNVIQNASNSGTNYHVYSYYSNHGSRILRNKINGTGSSTFYGIAILSPSNTISNPNLIANNFISQSVGATTAYGIYLSTANNTNVYYNSVNITGGGTSGRALYQTGGTGGINIVNNILSCPGGGYGYYISTPAAIATSDYNDIYSTGASIAYWSAGWATIAQLQAASGKEAHSVSANPAFISVSDLHTTNFAVYAAGTPLADVTDDIDLQPRSLIHPCIGAVEFTAPAVDAGIFMINAPFSPATGGSQPLLATLKNYGVDTLTSVTIMHEVNGNPGAIYNWAGSLPTGDTVMLNIGTINLATGISNIRAWTSMPNAVMDTVNMNDTAEVNVIVCGGPLAGTYTIGASGADFPSFNVALNALIYCGVGGPVTFNVATGTYNERMDIPAITGASAVNTITFQSASGLNTDVVLRYGALGTTDNYVVQLNGADYIRFRNMTIQSVTPTTYGRVIVLQAGADYNEFTGSRLHSIPTTSSNAAVIYSYSSSSDNYNLFENNEISNAYYGIYFYGASSYHKIGNSFINNNITGWYYYGMYTYYNDSIQVIGNTFQNGTAGTTAYTCYNYYTTTNSRFMKNKIHGTNTGTFYGIALLSNTAVTGKPTVVANNFISQQNSTGTAYGIYLSSHNLAEIYYNSINMAGGSSTAGRGLYQTSGTGIDIKNNIFVNTNGGYAYYIGTPTAVVNSDYNDYYATGATLAYWGSAAANLAALQTLNAKDSNSINDDPVFTSVSDLHVNSAAVNAKGTPIAGITDDIDGDLRNPVTPDIGADEFNPSPIDIATVQIVQPSAFFSSVGASVVVEGKFRNFGSDTITAFTAYYKYANNPAQSFAWTGVLPPSQTVNHTFTVPFNALVGANSLCVYAELTGDGDHGNDTLCTNYTGVPVLTVPYSDDFEGTVYWYANGGLNQWEHGVPTATVINNAYSPTHCWTTNLDGDYAINSNDVLYTPYFDFTLAHNGKMEFYHWMQSQPANDYGYIQYSVNNGATWITLGYQGDPAGTNWYDSFVGGKPCWSKLGTGWEYSSFDLSSIPAIVNSVIPVQFRFVFVSNASTNYNGWALDNFAISAPPVAKDAGVSAFITPMDSTMVGTPVSVSVWIKNYGTDSLQSVPLGYNVDGGAVVNAVWSGAALNPGDSVSYTFGTTFISPANPYTICAFTKRTDDPYKFNDTTCTMIYIKPAQNDAGVIAILMPGDTTVVNSVDSVKIRIQNFGTNVLTSIPVGYKRNGVQVAAEVWSGSLNPGDSVEYTFTATYTSPYGNYSICAYTMISGDPDPGNDELCTYPVGEPVGISDYDLTGFNLMQNIPNPANNKTTIPHYLPYDAAVKMDVVNMVGKMIVSVSEEGRAGLNQIVIDVKDIPAGVYFYTLTFEGRKLTKRMVITK